MAQTVNIPNGIPVFKLEEVVIGSQFKFAIQFKRLVSTEPDVFEFLDFTGMTLEALIKDKPAKEIDDDADAAFTCTARVGGEGWVDLYLDGDVTGTLLEKVYYASLKVYPTANPEKGDTLAAIWLPMKYEATR